MCLFSWFSVLAVLSLICVFTKYQLLLQKKEEFLKMEKELTESNRIFKEVIFFN